MKSIRQSGQPFFLKSGLRGQVHFTADDGFDLSFFTLLVEFDGPKEVHMVGDGNSLHAMLPGGVSERLRGHQRVQKRELRVVMKVYKCHMCRLL